MEEVILSHSTSTAQHSTAQHSTALIMCDSLAPARMKSSNRAGGTSGTNLVIEVQTINRSVVIHIVRAGSPSSIQDGTCMVEGVAIGYEVH